MKNSPKNIQIENKENNEDSVFLQPSKKYRVDFTNCLQKSMDEKSKSISTVDSELTGFLELGRVPLKTNVFEWWSQKQANYPTLFEIAKKFMYVPATSAPSERVFSYAGLILNQKRSCLKGKHVDSLVFLKMNKFE
jgi:hypothetical protein